MDRRRTFPKFWFVTAVTVFAAAACTVSDADMDDPDPGPGTDGSVSGSCAPRGAVRDCTDACGREGGLQICDGPTGALVWGECTVPGSSLCDAGASPDAGVSDAGGMDAATTDGGGEEDGGLADGGSSDADTDAGMSGGDHPAGEPCTTSTIQRCEAWLDCQWVLQACDAATHVWTACLLVGSNRCMSDAGIADAGPMDAGAADAGSCGCGDSSTILGCTTACGLPGAQTCADACAGDPCLPVFPEDHTVDGVCPEIDAGPADSGTCACSASAGGFCPVACGIGRLTCNPSDCSTSCVTIASTCHSDAGPTDAGPTDSGPADMGPTDSGPTDAGTCACPHAGVFCATACGGPGVTYCTAAPACTQMCFPTGSCPDGGTPSDAGPSDSGPVDAGPTDAGPMDAGPVDSGPTDSGPADTGPVDAGPMSDAGSGGLIIMLSATAQTACSGGFILRNWGDQYDATGQIIRTSSAPGGVLMVPANVIMGSGYINNTVLCPTTDTGHTYFGMTRAERRAYLGHRMVEWDRDARAFFRGSEITDNVFFCWDQAYADHQIDLGHSDKSVWDEDFVRLMFSAGTALTGCPSPYGP